ncbi:MAG TPA: 30S ribosomal protein S1 [Candidatus Dormibacteraeota bacterium]|jgi:small subunit ribosomal protein S1|nr:30S ribosomal protein S1 [Candidatus Dormibacteraeota bacterium]
MEEFLNQEEASSKRIAHGDIIDGVVVRVDPDEVLVDVGSKSEGVISSRELGTREAGTPDLHSGDHIKVFVLQPENEDGNVVLSLRRARAESVWIKAQDQQASGEMMDAEVREQNKGGLIVNILGLRGFLPTSQVSRTYSSNLQELVGQRIGVKILEVNRKRNRLIVSQKAAFDEDRARQRGELFEKLKIGDEIQGKVSGLTTYGAFVNLGAADGLIHISELSWDRVANVGDVLQVGQDVQVKVIKLDPDTSRISLSLRQLGQDPWDHIEKRFPPGAIVEGEVTKIKKYGAFLQIGDGIEGLLHISELAWEHVEHTEDVVQVGQKLKVRVLQADRSRRRISLSLKQAEEPPPGGHAEETEVSDYPGEIERVPQTERQPVYAEVSAAPQE